MTIAICLKVGDGVVLGADSAGTLMDHRGVHNVYFNMEKISNLRKGLPIGMITYGLGGLGGRSIASLAKDLRKRFSEPGPWHLDAKNYTMQEVAQRVREFFYDEYYNPEYENSNAKPALGFMIAGFSAGAVKSEVWTVEVNEGGACTGPDLLYGQDHAGDVSWRGEPHALWRLVYGYAPETWERLVNGGLPPDDATRVLQSHAPLAHPAMPIQDAIDLVDYLATVTCGYVRFKPGAPTVAPPIDIAAITLHERFRWVKRKHYYPSELNPPPEWDPGRPWPQTGEDA